MTQLGSNIVNEPGITTILICLFLAMWWANWINDRVQGIIVALFLTIALWCGIFFCLFVFWSYFDNMSR